MQSPEAPQPSPQSSVTPAAPQQRTKKLALPSSPPCAIQASTKTPPDRSCEPLPDISEATKLERFANSPVPLALKPEQKFKLAMKNTFDPFNLLSVGFFSAIDVATNSHGPYGPGMAGWARDSGTSLTEDLNGQFWGTFVMASIGHQDPHYHRMPHASIKRRILHTLDAVIIAQSDSGKPIPNYDVLGGSVISSSINNLYVPYARTNVASTADRVLVGFAFEPIGNAVTEFVPDIARRVNIRIVFVQKIINRVYAEESGGATLQ